MKYLILILSIFFVSEILYSEQLIELKNRTILEGIVIEDSDSVCVLKIGDQLHRLNKSDISERVDLYVELKMLNGEKYIGIVTAETDSILKFELDSGYEIEVNKSEISSRSILENFEGLLLVRPTKNAIKRYTNGSFPFYTPNFLSSYKNVFIGATIGYPCLMNIVAGYDFYFLQMRGSFGFFSGQLHLNYYIINNDSFKWAIGPGVGSVYISPTKNVYYILSTNIRWHHLFFEVGAFKFDNTREISEIPYFQIGYFF